MSIQKPDSDRLAQFKKEICKEYCKSTIIEQAVSYQELYESDVQDLIENFVKIGFTFRMEPDVLIASRARPGTYVHPGVLGVGHSIAFGEEKYLIDRIEKETRTKDLETTKDVISFIGSTPSDVSVAFLPHRYHTDLFHCFDMGDRHFLRIGKHRIRTFWSNVYVDFDKLFFLNRNSVEWLAILRQGTGHRLEVKVVYNQKLDKFDVTLQSMALVRVNEPQQVFVLRLPK